MEYVIVSSLMNKEGRTASIKLIIVHCQRSLSSIESDVSKTKL